MKSVKDITLTDVQARTIEEGDCLLWTGYAVHGKYPQWNVGGKVQPARRVVYEMVHGYVPKKLQIGTTCGCDLCVQPGHLVARSRVAVMRGKPLDLARKLKIARSKRAKSELTIDDVRAIRASTATGVEIDAQYGFSAGFASRIRAGLVWRDYAAFGAGLGARVPA